MGLTKKRKAAMRSMGVARRVLKSTLADAAAKVEADAANLARAKVVQVQKWRLREHISKIREVINNAGENHARLVAAAMSAKAREALLEPIVLEPVQQDKDGPHNILEYLQYGAQTDAQAQGMHYRSFSFKATICRSMSSAWTTYPAKSKVRLKNTKPSRKYRILRLRSEPNCLRIGRVRHICNPTILVRSCSESGLLLLKKNGYFNRVKSGSHPKPCFIKDRQDFRMCLKDWITGTIAKKERLTVDIVCAYIDEALSEDYSDEDLAKDNLKGGIGRTTAHVWMLEVGCKYERIQKSYFTDAPEKPAHVAYRNDVFIPEMFTEKPAHVAYRNDVFIPEMFRMGLLSKHWVHLHPKIFQMSLGLITFVMHYDFIDTGNNKSAIGSSELVYSVRFPHRAPEDACRYGHSTDTCARRAQVLESWPNLAELRLRVASLQGFSAELCLLGKLIISRGHILIKFPPAHPEIAGGGIEYHWGGCEEMLQTDASGLSEPKPEPSSARPGSVRTQTQPSSDNPEEQSPTKTKSSVWNRQTSVVRVRLA
jgi:hypothetical protein